MLCAEQTKGAGWRQEEYLGGHGNHLKKRLLWLGPSVDNREGEKWSIFRYIVKDHQEFTLRLDAVLR